MSHIIIPGQRQCSLCPQRTCLTSSYLVSGYVLNVPKNMSCIIIPGQRLCSQCPQRTCLTSSYLVSGYVLNVPKEHVSHHHTWSAAMFSMSPKDMSHIIIPGQQLCSQCPQRTYLTSSYLVSGYVLNVPKGHVSHHHTWSAAMFSMSPKDMSHIIIPGQRLCSQCPQRTCLTSSYLVCGYVLNVPKGHVLHHHTWSAAMFSCPQRTCHVWVPGQPPDTEWPCLHRRILS
ncbi:hypothetical protein DPMN_153377 [Dreissena polymorpha]|uniref:Uncharacterized protein n=1 Tax=Dreissena polymorpha TaxID=45954 RepID=A0A9D4J9C0_DREPO|nr:hypothetical protein DPMN_153377 [Dreissena polymorpha]